MSSPTCKVRNGWSYAFDLYLGCVFSANRLLLTSMRALLPNSPNRSVDSQVCYGFTLTLQPRIREPLRRGRCTAAIAWGSLRGSHPYRRVLRLSVQFIAWHGRCRSSSIVEPRSSAVLLPIRRCHMCVMRGLFVLLATSGSLRNNCLLIMDLMVWGFSFVPANNRLMREQRSD